MESCLCQLEKLPQLCRHVPSDDPHFPELGHPVTRNLLDFPWSQPWSSFNILPQAIDLKDQLLGEMATWGVNDQ